MTGRIAALDLGSGTIKLSVFERVDAGWRALCLDEVNTELRKGMGAERRLQPEPIADTVAACRAFLQQAKGLGVEKLPAYGTSAVRKARNPEALIAPLQAMGIVTTVLGEEDEGRLNLLGAASQPFEAPGFLSRTHSGAPQGRLAVSLGLIVLDPGGDSSECCADLTGEGWRGARVASLPFGSVSLQERFGSAADNDPIPWAALEATLDAAKAAAHAHPQFAAFCGRDLMPAIRMNLPIQRALEQVNSLPAAAHGQGGTYAYAHLQALTQAMAATDHAGRAALMDGEPLGKVDRSCYGFASWLGVLQALGAESFRVEAWGIKLGAALYLNGQTN